MKLRPTKYFLDSARYDIPSFTKLRCPTYGHGLGLPPANWPAHLGTVVHHCWSGVWKLYGIWSDLFAFGFHCASRHTGLFGPAPPVCQNMRGVSYLLVLKLYCAPMRELVFVHEAFSAGIASCCLKSGSASQSR